MNIIKTSDILDPSIQQPFTGRSLDFLQNSTKELISGLVLQILGDSYNGVDPYVLNGLTKAGNIYATGYIYYSGELYLCSGKDITGFANPPMFQITTTNDPTADPITFTDSISRNVHNIRRLEIVDSVTGDFLLSTLSYASTTAQIAPTFTAPYTAHASSPIKYRKSNKTVTIKGATNTAGAVSSIVADSPIFTLPAGYRPAQTKYFVAMNTNAVPTGAVASIMKITTAGVVSIAANLVGSDDHNMFIECSFDID